MSQQGFKKYFKTPNDKGFDLERDHNLQSSVLENQVPFIDLFASFSLLVLVLSFGTMGFLFHSIQKLEFEKKGLMDWKQANISFEQNILKKKKELLSILSSDSTHPSTDLESDRFTLHLNFDSSSGGLTFASGSHTLTKESEALLREKGLRLVEEVCSEEAQTIQEVTIEGQTDDVPYSTARSQRGCSSYRDQEPYLPPGGTLELGFCNNVRLSTLRAQEVYFRLREIVKDRSSPSLLTCFQKNFVIMGRSPRSTQETLKGSPESLRRVDWVVRFKHP